MMASTKQRARLATLLAELTSSMEKEPAQVDDWALSAGFFGKLPEEVVVLIVHSLLQLPTQVRCGVQLHEHAKTSVRSVIALLSSAKYLDWCFRSTGNELRLELAARQLTNLMPTNLKSPMVFFEQVLAEERSKFDIGVLESALNSMLTHCCSEHCRGPRRVFNASPAPEPRASMPLLDAVLNGRKPHARVVRPNSTTHMAVSAESDICVLALNTTSTSQTFVVAYRDEPSSVFDPCSDINTVSRYEMKEEYRGELVDLISASPCGEYVAMTKRSTNSRGEHRGSLIVFKKDTMQPIGELCYENIYLKTIWFCPVDVASPPNICWISYNVRAGQPLHFSERMSDSIDWQSNGIYQFGLDGGFQETCRQASIGVSFQRIGAFEDAPDVPSLRPTSCMTNWPEDSDSWDGIPARAFGGSALLEVSVAACGRCVAGIANGRSLIEEGMVHYKCAQVVFYECPLEPPSNPFQTMQIKELTQERVRNKGVVAITSHHIESMDTQWRLRTVSLSPHGDTAVVFVQARNGEFFVHVYIRVSQKSGFTLVLNLRLESAIQKPLGFASYTIRMPPTATVFSPCGRYLLVAFGDEPEGLGALYNKTGLFILDLCEVTPGSSKRTDVAYLECRSDLLPEQMLWNSNGLWLLQKEGVILLGL